MTNALGGFIPVISPTVIDGSGQNVTLTRSDGYISLVSYTELTIKNLTVTGGAQVATDAGGVMSAEGGTFRNIQGPRSPIEGHGGGSVSVLDCQFIDNTPLTYGGAVFINGASINVRRSVFRNNSSPRGGGIYATASTVSIFDSVFDSNTAAPTDGSAALGGAIYLDNSDLGITRSALINNVAQGTAGGGSTAASGGDALGGGIRLDSGARPVSISIDNTTLSGNRAISGRGGRGFAVGGNGGFAGAGAISQEGGNGGEIRLSSVTFADNYAQVGGSGSCSAPGCVPGASGNAENLIYRIARRVVMKNSLFITKFGGNCISYPGMDDRGFNLEYGSGGCTDPAVASNLYTNPSVLPLADNGGATPTIALASGSPAISAGAIGCLDIASAPNTVDQRSLPRKTPRCDIGAYETQPLPLAALTGVLSRKLHGPAGPFDLAIDQTVPIGGAITVEPRTIGSGHTIVFQFDAPIISVGAVSAVDGAANPVGAATAAIAGNAMEVTLTGVPDNQRALVSMSNINGIGINVSAAVGFLAGDVNNTRSVNSSDISGVKARSGQTVTASNFMLDIDTSGAINLSDISAVKVRSGLVLSQ
ncbi:MAG: hypothetical protein IPP88_19305 [Betaproteobacteria bacterium]|nr:hypothetical protein [Betaproteobacteria bacterium]